MYSFHCLPQRCSTAALHRSRANSTGSLQLLTRRCHSLRQFSRIQAERDAGASTSAETPATPGAPPPKKSSSGPAAVNDSIPEQLYYEGSASNAELIISLLLAATLVYIPITIAVIGKRLWIKYKFTNKRVTISNSSPLFANQVQVSYKNIKEVRTAPRAFGLWGDCVIFLKDGSRLEITGLERFQDIKQHILSCIYD